MQEEKKPQANGGEQKKQKHRRHGYFIQPPTNEAGTQKPANVTETVAHTPTQQQKHESKNVGNPHHKKKNHHSKPQNAQSDGNEQQAVPSNQSNQSNQGNQATNQANHQSHHKKKNNKQNKNRQKHEESSAPVKEAVQNQASDEQKSMQKQSKDEKAKSSRPAFKDTKPHGEHSADDYEAYRLTVTDDEIAERVIEINTQSSTDAQEQTEVVGIRFKSSGKVYYFNPNGHTLKRGTYAIVDTARGQEYGEVAMTNTNVNSSEIVPPLRDVIRPATPSDTEHHRDNKEKEEQAFKVCQQKITEHGLEMKLIDAQYTFDNSKLLFYFTSASRVDFRELVKDLASVFRTRIELRQIGIRDEAKLMGGLGMCGRPLCCTLFLYDFDQVSIKMAKEQNLSLNSAKISGICGRLMCCLKYEHEAYEYEIKRTPPVDSLVRTESGDGIVTEISPLQGTVKVRLLASPEVPPKVYHRDDVMMLRKKQSTESK